MLVIEYPEAALGVVSALAARIAATGGAALFLDYGPERSAPGDSLQALRDKKPADPLVDPGSADLTAHVDFARLADAARAADAAVFGPVPQGEFLARLGLLQRTDALARLNPGRADALRRGRRAAGRAGADGTAVQGARHLPQGAADAGRICCMIEPLTLALGTPHGFFTRVGGVSEGPYASLNCSLSGQDLSERVLENRARVARALGAAPDALVGLTQVHGSRW